jgi:hypothetical protein
MCCMWFVRSLLSKHSIHCRFEIPFPAVYGLKYPEEVHEEPGPGNGQTLAGIWQGLQALCLLFGQIPEKQRHAFFRPFRRFI